MLNPLTRLDNGCHSCLFTCNTVAPFFTVEPKDTEGNEGSEVRVECRADGHPRPSVSWARYGLANTGFKRGTRQGLALNSNVLTIDSLSSSDAGAYVCQASNSVGSITRRIMISVRAGPQRKRRLSKEILMKRS